MKTKVISFSSLPNTSARVEGVASRDFKTITWRGQDLLVQLKNGDVLVLQGANAKRLAVPGFFLVFDDASVPLALFSPGLAQPVLGKAPHVPPFEGLSPASVVKLPGGASGKSAKGRKAGKASQAADDQSADAWADRAMAELAQSEMPVSRQAVGTPLHSLVPEVSTIMPAAAKSDEVVVQAMPSQTSNLQWAWPAMLLGAGALSVSQGARTTPATLELPTTPVATDMGTVAGVVTLGPVIPGNNLLVKVYDAKGNLLGAEAAKADGSFAVTLMQKPASGVIRVEVVGVADAKPDFMGEDKVLTEFVGTVSAVTTWLAGGASKVNVTHATDVFARQLADTLANTTPEQLKAVSAAFAKTLGVGDGSTPLELIAPQPTVALGSNGQAVDAVADLYGQLLKALFEEVKAAQATAATDSGKVQAANAVLNQVAQGGSALAEVLLAAKVGHYADSPATANAPTVADYKAAGIDATETSLVALNAAAVTAVKSGSTLAGAVSAATADANATPTNAAPTAVTLTSVLADSKMAENTPVTTRLKVADIAVADDGLGSNTITLEGADKESFEVQGNALYLKADTVLDYETKTSYAVTVKAQDSSVAGSSSVSASYTLKVTDVAETPPAVNHSPTASGTVEAVAAIKGQAIAAIDLATKFTDSDAGDALSYAVTGGSLPAGLVLGADGKITGTPTAVTSVAAHITVTATDSRGLTATQNFDVSVMRSVTDIATTIDSAVLTPMLSTSNVAKDANWMIGTALSLTQVDFSKLKVVARGISWLPDFVPSTGEMTLTQEGAVVSNADGSKSVWLTAHSSYSLGVKLTFTQRADGLHVRVDESKGVNGNDPINLEPTALEVVGTLTLQNSKAVSGHLDVALREGEKVQVFDGVTPLGFATVAADGLHWTFMDSRDGVNTSASYTAKAVAGSLAGASSSTLDVVYNHGPVSSGTVEAVAAIKGQAIAAIDLATKFTDSDAGDALSYAVTGGSLPAGLVLGADGKITGTPTAAISAPVHITVTATDRGGLTATQSFDVSIAPSVADIAATIDSVAQLSNSLGGVGSVWVIGNQLSLSQVNFSTLKVKGRGISWLPDSVPSTGEMTLTQEGAVVSNADGSKSVWLTAHSSYSLGVKLTFTQNADGLHVRVDESKGVNGNDPINQPPTTLELVGSLSLQAGQTVKGHLDTALLAGAQVQVFDGITLLGHATVAADGLSWSFEDSRSTMSTAAYSAKVVLGGVSSASSNVVEVVYNHAPTASGTVEAMSVIKGQPITAIDLTSKFTDPDAGDALTYAVTGGSLPAGLVLGADGKITGTPTAVTSVAAHITVTATDSRGLTVTQSFDVSVADATPAPGGTDVSPAVDTSVPAWISASAYQVEAPVAATVSNPGSYAQGMGSLISNDVSAGTPAYASMASWLGMDSDRTQRLTGASMTAPLQLSYAFQNPGARFNDTSNVEHVTQEGMSYTDTEKAYVRKVFNHFAEVSNVVFTENESQEYLGADLRLFKGTGDHLGVDSSVMGFAIQPTSVNSMAEDAYGNLFLVTDASAYPSADKAFQSEYGSENTTVTHELGHAMGLDHPFEESDLNGKFWFGDGANTTLNRVGNVTGGGYDNPQTDAPQETVMTYLQAFNKVTLHGQPALIDSEGYTPWKLGVYDIAALQHLYGANMNTRIGNDTYSYDSDTPVFDTIWDAKGVDSLQQLGSRDAIIDLRGGEHMSRMGLMTGASYTFSQSAWESSALEGMSAAVGVHGILLDQARVSNVRFAYTDPTTGDEIDVTSRGHVVSKTVGGDTHWTWYDDPMLPAGVMIQIKGDFDYSFMGSHVMSQPDFVFGQVPGGGVPDVTMAYNIGVAFGVVIENAIGGGGNDVIWGNAAANTIATGEGRDVVKYDTAANINGDTITDFSGLDKLDFSLLSGLTRDALTWDAETKKLSYTAASSADSWSMTIQGSFDKAQVILAV